MTRPTAPILTADYHTYSAYSNQNDYYGGFEPKNDMGYSQGPMRMEPVICKNKSRCKPENSGITHFVISFYAFFSLLSLAFIGYVYYSGIRNQMLLYLAVLLAISLLTCLLMQWGYTTRNPFPCIPFVVLRVMETIVSASLVLSFGCSIYDPSNDVFKFFARCTKFFLSLLPVRYKINIDDATMQFCMIMLLLSLGLFCCTLFMLRVSCRCIMWLADQFQARRFQKQSDHSRLRIASDELYCN